MVVLNKIASTKDEKQKSRFGKGLEIIFGEYEPKPFEYIDKQIESLIVTITEDYRKMHDNEERLNPTEYIDIDLTLLKIYELSQSLEMLKSILTDLQSDSI